MFRGLYEGRKAAIKKVPIELSHLATNEIQTLIMIDCHPNIITYFGQVILIHIRKPISIYTFVRCYCILLDRRKITVMCILHWNYANVTWKIFGVAASMLFAVRRVINAYCEK